MEPTAKPGLSGTDYPDTPPSILPAIGWDSTYLFRKGPGEYDDLTPGPVLSCPCTPYLSAMGSTVGTGGHMPSSYSEQAGKRARDVTIAEGRPEPSVKRSRGAITGHGSLEVQELIAGCAGDITITEEGPGSPVKHSTGEGLLGVILQQLDRTKKQIIEYDRWKYADLIENSSLSKEAIDLLKKVRRTGRNKLSQQVCREDKQWFQTDLKQEIEELKVQKLKLVVKIQSLERDIACFKCECNLGSIKI